MPIYEYGCDKCGHEFEAEQRITDTPLKSCPECRSRKVRRLISRTSFVLKGGGWYSDLYSSDAKKADASPEGSAKPGSDEKADTKSEPKSDAASPASDSGKSTSKKKGPKAAA